MVARFTPHIAMLEADTFPDMGFWNDFSNAVRLGLKRRGLLDLRPSILGYQESDWDVALGDIVFDCYQFAILKRLNALKQQLKVRQDIDGLIIRNINHFFLEKQRGADPLGYAVFKNLEAGLLLTMAIDAIRAEGLSDGNIRNKTRFYFGDNAANELVSADELRDAVRACPAWQDNIALLARQSDRAQQLIAAGLGELQAQGIPGFTFKDLVDILKTNARNIMIPGKPQVSSMTQVAIDGDRTDFEIVRTIDPVSGYETTEHYLNHIRKVRQRIANSQKREKTKCQIERVLNELVALTQAGAEMPSQAELARRLLLPTSTLSDYMKVIRDAWKAC